jgi:hypothetical protein
MCNFLFLLSTERLQNTVLFLIVFRKSQRAQKTKILGSHDIEVVTNVLQNGDTTQKTTLSIKEFVTSL